MNASLNDAGAAARRLVRVGLKGSLATLDAASGAPYASMVLLATDVNGAPITLISGLARHTRNLVANPAASLLIDVSNAAGDAESGGRVTLMGTCRPIAEDDQLALASIRSRYLARHPAAAKYADFGDFAFYKFAIESAHFIEGFGRIVPLPGEALLPPIHDPQEFATTEPQAVVRLCQRWPQVTGLDWEGIDLRQGELGHRINFTSTVKNIQEAELVATAILGAKTSL